MAERQKHGFDYEQSVITKHSMNKATYYTATYDAQWNGNNVSIKCEKYETDIELGDYFRNASTVNDFILYIGFWQDTKNNIVYERIIKINGKKFHQLFYQPINEKLKTLLRTITNNKSDDKKWAMETKLLKKEWEANTNNLIRLRFKRDHKKQKRIQCAINFHDLDKLEQLCGY